LKYFLEFSYKGTRYHGWQIQPNAHTIQAEINRALKFVLGKETDTIASGRTDTGVHAKQQFLHFETDKELDTRLINRLNQILPHDISAIRFINVPETAHARFDATLRTYEYFISAKKQPFLENQYYFFHKKLDIDLMNQAGEILKNHIDFECFSKVHTDVNTFNCKISEAFWRKDGELLVFKISADRFLRNMVRAIVGTMLDLGTGKISLSDFHDILNSKNRSRAGQSVSPDGLYLIEIKYPYL